MSGLIGGAVRKRLEGRYELTALNRSHIPAMMTVRADIADFDAIRPAFEGQHSVVHLAASARGGDPWEDVRDPNVIGTHNVFEAARQAGVKRVIYASSVHAVGFYPRSRTIDSDVTVLPDSRYGVSKAFGEALGALYANKYGLEVMAVRIGNAYPSQSSVPGWG